MASFPHAKLTVANAHPAPATAGRTGDRARRRAILVTALVTAGTFALFVDLLLVGHASGEEIWGPVTAASGTVVGLLSLVFLAVRGRDRRARLALYALWLTVAFFGFGGYNDHRLPVPEGVVDQRTRPPLAPLAFTGLAFVGAAALRHGSKGA